MKIEISYGKDRLGFNIPEKNLAGVIRPGKSQPTLNDEQIDRIISSNEFTQAVKNKYLCVLVPDGTRDLPIDTVLQSAAKVLKLACRIRFVVCTGTHNAKTERNELLISKIDSLMKKNSIRNFDIVAHDCEKAEFMVSCMFTSPSSLGFTVIIIQNLSTLFFDCKD